MKRVDCADVKTLTEKHWLVMHVCPVAHESLRESFSHDRSADLSSHKHCDDGGRLQQR